AWSPAYSSVAGDLPPGDVPRVAGDPAAVGFARCQLDVTTAGKVKLLLNSAAGLTLWVDGTPVEAKEQTTLDLASGVHTLTFGIGLGKRRDGLRWALEGVPGCPGRRRGALGQWAGPPARAGAVVCN